MPRPHIFRLSGLRGNAGRTLGTSPFFGGMSPLPAANPYPPIVSDTFTRADNNSLGIADSGQTWVALQGTWGITGNTAYLATDAGDSQCMAYVNSGQADGTLSVMLQTVGTGTDAGLAFRITDANNYYIAVWTQSLNELRIFRRLAGTFTQLGSSVSYTALNGDALSVVMSGSNFDFKVNGVSKIAVSDSNHTATNHGFRVYGGTDSVSRLDNFGMSAPVVVGYTLTADAGVFTETGSAAGLRAVRQLAAASGTFTESGTAAGLKLGRKVGAASGTFLETGTTASLRATRTLSSASGAFSLTGTAAGLRAARNISVGSAAYVLSGTAAGLVKTGGYILSALSGAFALSGTASGLNIARRTSGSSAAFSLSGAAAVLKTARKVGASSVGFPLTGSPATLRIARKLTASSATFTHTGQIVNLRISRVITISSGAFVFTVADATLDYDRGIDLGPQRSATVSVEPKPSATIIVQGKSAVMSVLPKPSATLTKWV